MILLRVVRGGFILLAGVAAWWVTRHILPESERAAPGLALFYSACASMAAAILVCVDIAFRRQFLRGFVSVVFGVVLGMLVSAVAVTLLCIFVWPVVAADSEAGEAGRLLLGILQPVVPLVVLACCYLSVSVVLRTKDEFRFVVPYVDFAEQGRTHGGVVLDSSVLIDGRIVDVAEKLLLNDALIVPRFVVDEMQKLADNPDRLIRDRGRRGLDQVGRLQANPALRMRFHEDEVPGPGEVDAKLVRLAQLLGTRLATNDLNLAKVARIARVEVISINDLATALRPPFIPGESLVIRIARAGEQRGQGVGYLEDGTMVVVESAADEIGKEVAAVITNMLQTPAGRMIFARKPGDDNAGGERPRKTDSRKMKRES
ncbi:MAG TPA: PIN/TRAM domain-containing protein [Planctomycetota bacterium]|nr:PIN/TRAM domain-containing protein [Planctomycetota bacterium]